MDRSADHTMDMNARPDMLGSPFPSHDDFESDAGNSQSDTIMDDPEQLDGSGGMFTRKGKPPTPLVAAIFVHAGAGYHSVTNEQFHLGVCSDACKMAMRMMKQGGGNAVDAVEAAIRVLEDREITNAGFGSNLTITGRVEGDATVVDHLGRSGACGATPQVKNPINLARMILELSSRQLSLRRVPPNLLVGQGATDFAREHGIQIVPHEQIISKNAFERYTRWKEDLRRAESQRPTPSPQPSSYQTSSYQNSSEEADDEGVSRRDHTNALLTGTWNEGQPDSPAPASPAPQRNSPAFYQPQIPDPDDLGTPISVSNNLYMLSPQPQMASSPPRANMRSPVSAASYGASPAKRSKHTHRTAEIPSRTQSPLGQQMEWQGTRNAPNVSDGAGSPLTKYESRSSGTSSAKVHSLNLDGEREDHITDTVGAIAIDCFGNIAAASSSGGIGMKHSGRVGPAALVGIGSAVIPVDDQDPDAITVAAVTSGTGEHMATTMASQKCCERLYGNTRKGPGPRGADIDCTEEDAIESFVTWDFMEHPGVRNSHSAGAIGVMAVKKMPGGYYLHFAHNTDSFALASMHSNETAPKCVMSRLGEKSKVVQGGRKVRAD